MEEKPNPPFYEQIPKWSWVIVLLLGLFFVNLWATGQFETLDQIPLSEVATYLENGTVEKISISDDELTITLRDGSEFNATKEPGISIFETFNYLGVPSATLRSEQLIIEDLSTKKIFEDLAFTIIPLLLLLWVFSRFFRQVQGGGNNLFGFGKSRARNLNDGDRPTVTFDDVAGIQEAKEEVQEVVQFLREPEKFIQVGARIPKGVLMVGPPGTGKTLLARAIAGEAGVPFFHISGSEFVEMFVGVGASRVRDLFTKAKENAPSIVFVDEIDAVGRQRGGGVGGGNDEREQTLNQILVEMDGFDNETNVIIIGATNRADVLDPALLRPGRFDRKVIVSLPDLKGREQILGIHTRGKPIGKDVALTDLARLTAGFSGADLENLVNEAAIFAARRSKMEVNQLEFQDAFDRIVMGPERKSRVMSEEDKQRIAYHEAGHALVSYNLSYTDPVQKITIIPRGMAGGYVMPLPADRMTVSTEFFEDQIAFALGGRAAEEIFFQQVTTGASSDLQKATQMARSMIMQYGMSKSLGLRTFGEESGNVFLGKGFSGRDYSEEAATKIDAEVKEILDRNYQRALAIIQANKNQMVKLVDKLLDVETLDRLDFESLMKPVFAEVAETDAV